jgi:hypothetical protein
MTRAMVTRIARSRAAQLAARGLAVAAVLWAFPTSGFA